MNLAARIKFEDRIAKQIIQDALALGYSVTVNNGGDDDEIENATDWDAIKPQIRATDEERFYFSKPGEKRHMVYMVYGESGWDVISDYSLSIEATGILTKAEEICTKAQEDDG